MGNKKQMVLMTQGKYMESIFNSLILKYKSYWLGERAQNIFYASFSCQI